MKKGVIAVDLFCGAGGLTRGLLDAGIIVKKGYDFDGKVKDTYEKNNGGVKFFPADISQLKGEEILEGIDRENYFFLLAGCAPCQPFSLINQSDNQKDKRKNLVLEFARLIEETKPDFLLMENVPGLKNGKGKEIFNEFESRVDNLGFFYDSKVLDAKNFEVPQKRKRLVFSASMH